MFQSLDIHCLQAVSISCLHWCNSEQKSIALSWNSDVMRVQDPVRAFDTSPWHQSEPLITSMSPSELTAFLAAHQPGAVPQNSSDIESAIRSCRLCGETLRQAAYALAFAALFRRVDAILCGDLPSGHLIPEAQEKERGLLASIPTCSRTPQVVKSVMRDTNGPAKGTGYSGDARTDAAMARSASQRSQARAAALNIDQEKTLIALDKMVKKCATRDACLPVRLRCICRSGITSLA
jgi:hypothetical protein